MSALPDGPNLIGFEYDLLFGTSPVFRRLVRRVRRRESNSLNATVRRAILITRPRFTNEIKTEIL